MAVGSEWRERLSGARRFGPRVDELFHNFLCHSIIHLWERPLDGYTARELPGGFEGITSLRATLYVIIVVMRRRKTELYDCMHFLCTADLNSITTLDKLFYRLLW
ncbi:hypothetical protein NDU88_005930 [Pleurodeles waltl]|uniref:Uncharacterized protein n=1 Tax=Pleurodeles waltl TaxID=8319 RepID=A0AAV7TYL7_PLEWA|nr:hypothetical protein NDU88_005930 [Pleurodeles waltl]